jgi:hypothetical protein
MDDDERKFFRQIEKELSMRTHEKRLIELELQHACNAIERARLIARTTTLEADLARLLGAAKTTLDLVLSMKKEIS